MSSWLLALLLWGQAAGQGAGQARLDVAGQIAFLANSFPRRDAAELRPSASFDVTVRPSTTTRLKLDGFIEGLAADRSGRALEAIARVREAWLEVASGKGEFRVGYGRVIWGRLDEIQPSDVINPLDTSRYLFDGRSAARLPVAFLRGRVFASETFAVDGVIVPAFRRGTFDELDESTSPFNLINDVVLPAGGLAGEVRRMEPAFALKNMSGGARVTGTVGRVDVAAAAFRGFDGFGLTAFVPDPASGGGPPVGPAVFGQLVQQFPRFTMVSADFETVAGEWALRGEAAFFVEKTFQRTNGAGTVEGRAVDAGVGVDRRTGEYRVFASAIVRREWSGADAGVGRTDVSLVGSIERQFRRDRWLARTFAVVNPADASGFVRGLIVWRPADNFAIEASAAAFVGDGDDTLARFRTRDFLLTRVRWGF